MKIISLVLLFAGLSMAQSASLIQSVSRNVYSEYLQPTLSADSQINLANATSIEPFGAAADALGNVIVSGSTSGNTASILMKIAPDGRTLFSVTIPNSVPTAVATDANLNIYVCGFTAGSFQTTPGVFLPSAFAPGFIAKLDPSGALLWATEIFAYPTAIALDSANNVYTTGYLYATGTVNGLSFETTPGALQSTNNDLSAFVAEISADGKRLLYATYLGGTGPDIGNTIAVGASGKVYVVGETGASDFPVTPNAYQSKFGGSVTVNQPNLFGPGPPITKYVGGDAFLVELDLNAGSILYSTFLGGSGVDFANGLAVDGSGTVFVTGTTSSGDFPVTAGASQAAFGGKAGGTRAGNSFIAAFDSANKALYVTFHGTTGTEVSAGAKLDSQGHLFFLEDEAGSTNACTPQLSIVEWDAKTGAALASESLPGFGLLNHSPNTVDTGTILGVLTIDNTGILTVAGAGSGDPVLFPPLSPKTTLPGWLLAGIDFSRQDQLVPWCVANAANGELEPDNGSNPSTEGFVGPAQYVAPGEIVSVYGVGLGPSATVSIGSRQLTVLYSASEQLNALVPSDLESGVSSTMSIQRGNYSVAFPVVVLPVFPGIFMSGNSQIVATNGNGTINSASNPALAGSTVSFFATGLGALGTAGVPSAPFTVVHATAIQSVVHPAGMPDGVFEVTVQVEPLGANPAGQTLQPVEFTITYGPPVTQDSGSNSYLWVQGAN